MNSTKILLGKKIRNLRKSRDWTQEQLSEKLGINSKSVLRIESGKTFPTIQNLEKLAEIFDVEIADLFVNHYMADVSKIKQYIYENLEIMNEKELRGVYNFIYCSRNMS